MRPKPQAFKKTDQHIKNHKYIFVIGGVMSGVGKGITTSSIGTILQSKGYSVNIAKVDPYLNVDAGTMNPTEHGEVFVLDSGLETDQDMGNYERFLNRDLANADYMTGGMVYLEVILKERALKYRGKCVDAVPHIRDEIIRRINASVEENKSDITIIEIGGTVGDYQSMMFYEASRIFKIKHPNDVLFVMVSYLPIPSKIGEMKSKPTQNAMHQLQSYGIQADFIIARSEVSIDHRRKEKLAVSCNVPVENIIAAPDIDSIYDVPINFERDKFGDAVEKALHLKHRKTDLSDWRSFVSRTKKSKSEGKEVHIAVVGKYFDSGDFVLSDAYVSVIESLKFSSYQLGVKPVLHWLSSKQFESNMENDTPLKPKEQEALLKKTFGGGYVDEEGKKIQFNGILVPGGFGETGIEGKIAVIRYAREHKIPYFGICYGMQLMVIEYARNMAGLSGANTSEINPKAAHLVVDIMEHQKKLLEDGKYGASMRLGGFACGLLPKTIAYEAYKKSGWVNRLSHRSKAYDAALSISKSTQFAGAIIERHRHRYEVNPEYVAELTKAGLVFSGTSPDGHLMEIAELPKDVHPFFLGVQFHPEFLGRPVDPHPIFTAFVDACRT
ncbi:MAG: CTP synthase [Candidatus Taylorbacteria bacterium]|nr:CTP synthase [Candidatus Taylorbacteria bacterium]